MVLQAICVRYLDKMRSYARQKKPIVAIKVTGISLELAVWQAGGKKLWSEIQDVQYGYNVSDEVFFENVREQLRHMLLEHEAEEGLDVIWIVGQELLHREELYQPRMTPKEQEKAMQWEAAECVPWEKGTYTIAYTMLQVDEEYREEAGQKVSIILYAMQNRLAETIQNVCDDILLNPVLITTGLDVDTALELWYRGAELREAVWLQETEPHLPTALIKLWPQHQFANMDLRESCSFDTKVQRRVAILGFTSVLCSMLLCIATYVMRDIATNDFEEQQIVIEHNKKWQERADAAVKQDREIKKLQKQVQTMQKERVDWSGQIANVAKALPPGVWLTGLQEGEKKEKTNSFALVVNGRAWDVGVVQLAVTQLQKSGKWKKVQLIRTGASGDDRSLDYEIKLWMK